MISSNSKVYTESIRNPTVMDFDYSYNQLNINRDLEFQPPRSFPVSNLITNSMIQAVNYIRNFMSPHSQKIPGQIRHIGVQFNNLTDTTLEQLVKIIKFSIMSNIEFLTISTAPRDKDQKFIDDIKFYLGLGYGQHGNNYVVTYARDTSTGINQDTTSAGAASNLKIFFNGNLGDLDVIIASELLIYQDDGELKSKDRDRKVRYLHQFTLVEFKDVLSDVSLTDNVVDGNIV